MSDKYEVEHMLKKLVEKDDNSKLPVYSWKKDINYRPKKTENMSVDDIIDTIEVENPKVRVKRARTVRAKAKVKSHAAEAEITPRIQNEAQESEKKLDNVIDHVDKQIDNLKQEPNTQKENTQTNSKYQNKDINPSKKNSNDIKNDDIIVDNIFDEDEEFDFSDINDFDDFEEDTKSKKKKKKRKEKKENKKKKDKTKKKEKYKDSIQPVSDEIENVQQISNLDSEENILDGIDNGKEENIDESKESKKYFYFGTLMFILAAIGIIAIIVMCIDNFGYGKSSSLKSKAKQAIYPCVVEDIEPFNDQGSISDNYKIGAAIIDILRDKNVKKYDSSQNNIVIPETDVVSQAKKIFGDECTINQHQNVFLGDNTFYYDANNKTYSLNKYPMIFTATPFINNFIKQDDNSYLAEVLYKTDYPDWFEKRSTDIEYTKACKYTLKKNSNGDLYVASMSTVGVSENSTNENTTELNSSK